MKLKWDLDWWLLGLTWFSLGLKWLYINYNLARWPMKKLAEFFSKTFAGFNLFFFNEMFYSMFISIIELMKTNSIGVFSTKKKINWNPDPLIDVSYRSHNCFTISRDLIEIETYWNWIFIEDWSSRPSFPDSTSNQPIDLWDL